MSQTNTPVKLETKEEMDELRNVLEGLLPGSVQVFNCVVLELLEDGVEREIFVNTGFSKDNLNVLVLDKSEKPMGKIIIFSHPYKNDELKHLLDKVLDFNKPLLFGVSFSYFCVYFSFIDNLKIVNKWF